MVEAARSPGSVTLDTTLGGVLGGRTAGAFRKAFGFERVGDLLAHYPRRYARRGELTALDELPVGENVTIVAEVREVRQRPMRARRGSILDVRITDGRGFLSLTFFNQDWRSAQLKPGVRGIFAGKVSHYQGSPQLTHPDYELFDDLELVHKDAARWAEQPIPIYPATSSVASWQIQKAVALVLDALVTPADPVPAQIRHDEGLLPLGDAFDKLHRPARDSDWRSARDTLRFHEAFILQAALLEQRERTREMSATPRVPAAGGYLERFDAQLPFSLTGDQQLVGQEIASDMSREYPMNRLVQGEVGSGKTLVALRAMLAVADSGGQSALLAPTEVLAVQHLRSITKMLGPDLAAELMPTLHTGQQSTQERRSALLRTVSGHAKIVVGTHALLGDKVEFYDLGLVVVDEQHRFGVEQREALRVKSTHPPHVLVLTATPIPRTVAMTVFGDLEVSTISQLPTGRQGIQSFVVGLSERPGWFDRVWQRTAEELAQGRQAFVVCPAIEPSVPEPADAPDAEEAESEQPRAIANVLEVLARLREHPALSNAVIEPLHGRMSGDDKERVMSEFAAGRIDVLVATTVIEVGVDVPNASTMIVLDADRFGVSQLHQLRGRVGRGGVPGICLLVTHAEEGTLSRERVDAVAATTDGFALAQVDLELRREGDVLGSTQSGGRSSLKLLRVVHDGDLIAHCRALAAGVIEEDPDLSDHPELREAIRRRLDERDRAYLSKG